MTLVIISFFISYALFGPIPSLAILAIALVSCLAQEFGSPRSDNGFERAMRGMRAGNKGRK